MKANIVRNEYLGQSLQSTILDSTKLLTLLFSQVDERTVTPKSGLPAEIRHGIVDLVSGPHRSQGIESASESTLPVAQVDAMRSLAAVLEVTCNPTKAESAIFDLVFVFLCVLHSLLTLTLTVGRVLRYVDSDTAPDRVIVAVHLFILTTRITLTRL